MIKYNVASITANGEIKFIGTLKSKYPVKIGETIGTQGLVVKEVWGNEPSLPCSIIVE